MTDVAAGETASRVVLTYDPDVIDDISRFWVEDELGKGSYVGYIRRTYDTVSEGEDFDEFVSKGCSIPMDVTLRVERLDGGTRIGEDTAVDIRRRD